MQVVEPYANPTPPAGVHRYVVSLFLQPGSNKINVSFLLPTCTTELLKFWIYMHAHRAYTLTHSLASHYSISLVLFCLCLTIISILTILTWCRCQHPPPGIDSTQRHLHRVTALATQCKQPTSLWLRPALTDAFLVCGSQVMFLTHIHW